MFIPICVSFIQEHDNDAETLVSHLAVTIEDDDLDISKYSCYSLYFKWQM